MAKEMISIIVPVYNVAPYVGKCIHSIKNQRFCDWECVIVNDASTDNSAEIVEAVVAGDKRFKVISLERNGGLAAARNRAVKEASGEYLFYLDSDDWIEPTMLSDLYALAEPRQDVGRFATPKTMHWRSRGWSIPMSITPTGLHRPDSPYLFASSECDIGYVTGNLYRRSLLPEGLSPGAR